MASEAGSGQVYRTARTETLQNFGGCAYERSGQAVSGTQEDALRGVRHRGSRCGQARIPYRHEQGGAREARLRTVSKERSGAPDAHIQSDWGDSPLPVPAERTEDWQAREADQVRDPKRGEHGPGCAPFL